MEYSKKKVIVTVNSGNKRRAAIVDATVLANGKTVVPRSFVNQQLKEMGVKKGEAYSVS